MVVGVLLTLARLSKYRLLSGFARAYVSFLRGVPLLVMLFVVYFGFGADALPAAIIAFTLGCSAFVSEVFRSAFLGVEKVQIESAFSLGMSYSKAIRYVILPQAFRIAIPALGNIVIDLFKGTSLAAMITVSEMFMQAKIIAGANQDYMTLYILIAIIYWACCEVISIGQNLLEDHLTYA
jgi:cystine transport system permease protein